MFSFMSDENLFFSLTQKYTKQLLLQVFIRKKTKHGSKYLYLKAINKIAEKKKKIVDSLWGRNNCSGSGDGEVPVWES